MAYPNKQPLEVAPLSDPAHGIAHNHRIGRSWSARCSPRLNRRWREAIAEAACGQPLGTTGTRSALANQSSIGALLTSGNLLHPIDEQPVAGEEGLGTRRAAAWTGKEQPVPSRDDNRRHAHQRGQYRVQVEEGTEMTDKNQFGLWAVLDNGEGSARGVVAEAYRLDPQTPDRALRPDDFAMVFHDSDGEIHEARQALDSDLQLIRVAARVEDRGMCSHGESGHYRKIVTELRRRSAAGTL